MTILLGYNHKSQDSSIKRI